MSWYLYLSFVGSGYLEVGKSEVLTVVALVVAHAAIGGLGALVFQVVDVLGCRSTVWKLLIYISGGPICFLPVRGRLRPPGFPGKPASVGLVDVFGRSAWQISLLETSLLAFDSRQDCLLNDIIIASQFKTRHSLEDPSLLASWC